MKKLACVGLIAAAVVLAGAPVAGAGSIYMKANVGGAAPKVYSDDTARAVGDILTIIITERSTVTNGTKNSNEKKSDRSIKASGSIALNDARKLLKTLPENSNITLPSIDATSAADNKFEGTSDFASDRSMTDRITVTIHDVLPNGNLVLLGTRIRNAQGNVQVVTVSGIVRPSDISFSNTVLSEQIAEFHMVTAVRGPETHFSEPNWFGKFLNTVLPW
jgi:flagellar L-ring protein FlgH